MGQMEINNFAEAWGNVEKIWDIVATENIESIVTCETFMQEHKQRFWLEIDLCSTRLKFRWK